MPKNKSIGNASVRHAQPIYLIFPTPSGNLQRNTGRT